MSAMSAVYIQQRVWHVTRSHDLWHVLPTLRRTITKFYTTHDWRYCILVCTLSMYCAGCMCDFNTSLCRPPPFYTDSHHYTQYLPLPLATMTGTLKFLIFTVCSSMENSMKVKTYIWNYHLATELKGSSNVPLQSSTLPSMAQNKVLSSGISNCAPLSMPLDSNIPIQTGESSMLISGRTFLFLQVTLMTVQSLEAHAN